MYKINYLFIDWCMFTDNIVLEKPDSAISNRMGKQNLEYITHGQAHSN